MDKKAKQILFNTYWSTKGWKSEKFTDPQDFEYAKKMGLMFDKLSISHDDCVKRIIKAANGISKEQIAQAFLSSLSLHKLEWRSGIASYNAAKSIKSHKYKPVATGHGFDENGRPANFSYRCGVCEQSCGLCGNDYYKNVDLNVLNFERIKWGGVRHSDLIYVMFDLERFLEEEISQPTRDDIEIFKNILVAAKSCEKDDYPSILRDKLKDIPNFKSNKDERSVILEILACIGVLEPGSYNRPVRGKNDWFYIECWRGEDGYNEDVVKDYFGKYLE